MVQIGTVDSGVICAWDRRVQSGSSRGPDCPPRVQVGQVSRASVPNRIAVAVAMTGVHEVQETRIIPFSNFA